MTTKEKFVQLLSSLLEATAAGKVKWHETSKESSFRMATAGGIVRISRQSTNDGSNCSAALVDPKGRTLEELFSEDPDVDRDMMMLMEHLFDAARSSALNVDATIDRMLADITQGKTIQPPDEKKAVPDQGFIDDDLPF